MKSYISWVSEIDKIVQIRTVGMWNAVAILEAVREAMSLDPNYLIWDPSEVIFPPDHSKSYEESSQERQAMISIIAKALIEERLQLYFVIRRKKLSSFETMQGISKTFDIEDKVHFVASLEEAKTFIAQYRKEMRI